MFLCGYDFNLYFLITALLLLFKWYHVQQKHTFCPQSQMCWVNVIHSTFLLFLQLFLWIFVIFFNIDKFSYVFSLIDHSNICSIFSIFFYNLCFTGNYSITIWFVSPMILWCLYSYFLSFILLPFFNFTKFQVVA